MSRSITSIVAGTPVLDAPGGRITSTNPARTERRRGRGLARATRVSSSPPRKRPGRRSRAGRMCPPRCVAARSRTSAALVEANAESLARLVTREIGKPYAEALGEVREIVDTCDFFLGEGRRLYGQTVPSEMPDKQLFTFRNPVGVVTVITAGNFPVAVPSWYLIPALLCGNAVVWKPADYSPACGAALFDLLVRGGGLPDGVLNLVLADGETTFAGLERALDEGLRRQDRLHRVQRGRIADRRAHRPAPAVGLPGARRQEPDGRDAQRGARPRGRGSALLRLRHRRPAMHVARHRHRARERPRRLRRAVRQGDPAGQRRRPVRRCRLRPDAG